MPHEITHTSIDKSAYYIGHHIRKTDATGENVENNKNEWTSHSVGSEVTQTNASTSDQQIPTVIKTAQKLNEMVSATTSIIQVTT